MKKIEQKIIAGKYKNKSINIPSLQTTRSTKNILKESFFNTLQYDIIDSIFIEGFAGSGSVGLEALSRGSNKAYFCEYDKQAYKILERNTKNIDYSNSYLFLGNSFEILPHLINTQLASINKPIIIYLDPPFDIREGMNSIYQETFKMIESFCNKDIFLLAIEHKTGLEIPKTLKNFTLKKTKKFGNSSITYYKIDE